MQWMIHIHGSDRLCCHNNNPSSYKKGDFPISEKFHETSLSLPAPHFCVPAKSLIDQYLKAFKKVAEEHKKIIEYFKS